MKQNRRDFFTGLAGVALAGAAPAAVTTLGVPMTQLDLNQFRFWTEVLCTGADTKGWKTCKVGRVFGIPHQGNWNGPGIVRPGMPVIEAVPVPGSDSGMSVTVLEPGTANYAYALQILAEPGGMVKVGPGWDSQKG